MTAARELAEKMHKALYCHFDYEGYDKKDVDEILCAGINEAYERAAKVADRYDEECGEAIRALKEVA